MNCHNCGTPLTQNAAICRLCGVAQKPPKAQPGKRTLPRWFFIATAAAAAIVTAGISVFSAVMIAQMVLTPRETVIVMEDANLEKAVCDYLEITDESLTVEGVKDVAALDLKGKDITDLSPLTH